jgi:hypothetical protein
MAVRADGASLGTLKARHELRVARKRQGGEQRRAQKTGQSRVFHGGSSIVCRYTSGRVVPSLPLWKLRCGVMPCHETRDME